MVHIGFQKYNKFRKYVVRQEVLFFVLTVTRHDQLLGPPVPSIGDATATRSYNVVKKVKENKIMSHQQHVEIAESVGFYVSQLAAEPGNQHPLFHRSASLLDRLQRQAAGSYVIPYRLGQYRLDQH